ncbi:hypothetical protein [Klebsiella pneumoniae]|uniref:hypothetical protein n=1 Tax=Klebsiella pneumoniae TaxID=573 RepID=UPI003975989B
MSSTGRYNAILNQGGVVASKNCISSINEVVDNDAFHKLPVIVYKAQELALWILDGGADVAP